LGSLSRELARQKEREIGGALDGGSCAHADVDSTQALGVAGAGYIKGKSAIHIARTYGGKRRNFVGQHFWARGYWVSTVGHNEAAVRKYIQDQEKEDKRLDQLGLFEGERRFERFTISSLRLCRRYLTAGICLATSISCFYV